MEKISQSDWKKIGKTASLFMFNFWTEEKLKERAQQVIDYLEAKIAREKEWIDKTIRIRPMEEKKEESGEKQENSDLAELYKSINQKKKERRLEKIL
jgi:hypothetical protein